MDKINIFGITIVIIALVIFIYLLSSLRTENLLDNFFGVDISLEDCSKKKIYSIETEQKARIKFNEVSQNKACSIQKKDEHRWDIICCK